MVTTAWRFDFYYTLPFWIALLVAVVVVRVCAGNKLARSLALLACSNAMLLAIPQVHLLHLGLVWLVALVTYGVNAALQGTKDEKRRTWLGAFGVIAVLAFLAFFKYRFIQGFFGRSAGDYVFLVGVSYFSFKAIHVVVESVKGGIGKLDALTHLNYLTFFPAFVSGPINRYPQFAETLAAETKGTLRRDLLVGGERLIHGMFKKFVLVRLVQPYILSSRLDLLEHAPLWDVAVTLYASALFAYFDFSGYSDLAIGAARLLGVELPENFNWPIIQKNIREFWTNWHMSLTSWLIDYIYWPAVRRLRNRAYFQARPVLLSIVGMNLTFFVCGVWHGEAPRFAIWGIYHGLGITILQLYQRQKRKVKNAALRKYFGSKYSRAAGAVAAFSFFALGLTLFTLDLGQVAKMFSALTLW